MPGRGWRRGSLPDGWRGIVGAGDWMRAAFFATEGGREAPIAVAPAPGVSLGPAETTWPL